MINLKKELKQINIQSICVKCKSCLSELKCMKHPNGSFKFVCPNHDIIENASIYFYEIRTNTNKCEVIRKPSYDVTNKVKPISFCFSFKTNNSCRLKHTCLFPHSINEQNVWEILRKHKLTMDEFVIELLKTNNSIENLDKNLSVYSLSSDLDHIIKTKNLKKLQIFLSFFDESILLTENSSKQTILHRACKSMSLKTVKFLLNYNQLSECFGGKMNLSMNTFKTFINHKDKHNETALSFLLKKNCKNTDKFNQMAMLFFNTEEFNLKQLIGNSEQQTTIMHMLIERKNLKLIQYLCFNHGDKIDLTKLKNSKNLSSRSLASLNSSNSNSDKEIKKISDTINACLISKIVRNYITVGMNLNEELITEQDLDSIEFGFKKFKFII